MSVKLSPDEVLAVTSLACRRGHTRGDTLRHLIRAGLDVDRPLPVRGQVILTPGDDLVLAVALVEADGLRWEQITTEAQAAKIRLATRVINELPTTTIS